MSSEYQRMCCAGEGDRLHAFEGPGGKGAAQRGDVDGPHLVIRFVYMNWPHPTTSSTQVTHNG